MTSAEAGLIWCPFPDQKSAHIAAEALLNENLVACANILPSVNSVFVWEGEIATSQEVAVLFKTTVEKIERAIEHLGDIHPYDTPAIMGWGCDSVHESTLDWLQSNLSGKERFL